MIQCIYTNAHLLTALVTNSKIPQVYNNLIIIIIIIYYVIIIIFIYKYLHKVYFIITDKIKLYVLNYLSLLFISTCVLILE